MLLTTTKTISIVTMKKMMLTLKILTTMMLLQILIALFTPSLLPTKILMLLVSMGKKTSIVTLTMKHFVRLNVRIITIQITMVSRKPIIMTLSTFLFVISTAIPMLSISIVIPTLLALSITIILVMKRIVLFMKVMPTLMLSTTMILI